jgi:hypothetical protein
MPRLRSTASVSRSVAARGPSHPAAVVAGFRFDVLEIGREVVEDGDGRLGQRDVLRHRVVRAQNARRLGRGAASELSALQQQHAAAAEPRQVVRNRCTDHAAADDHNVEFFHLLRITKMGDNYPNVHVIPAKAGIQRLSSERHWVPAFAGTTVCGGGDRHSIPKDPIGAVRWMTTPG